MGHHTTRVSISKLFHISSCEAAGTGCGSLWRFYAMKDISVLIDLAGCDEHTKAKPRIHMWRFNLQVKKTLGWCQTASLPPI